MGLQSEIEQEQRQLKTDHYTMSLGELITMYTDGDLIINPEFQRLFRWTAEQKSRLIESILLGIPIPSIFVYETPEGRWELVDGLQRMATILEFTGNLRGPGTEEKLPPSVLEPGRYLKSLRNVVWQRDGRIAGFPENQQIEIGRPLQLAIRHCRISLEILKRPSDIKTKYDLFQRLNSGGTIANPQELRNCAVVMVNSDFFKKLRSLSADPTFVKLLRASEDQKIAQKELEYVMRFFVYRYVPYDGRKDVEEYITDGIVELAASNAFDEAKRANFMDTFRLLDQAIGPDALKGKGKIGLTGLEAVAIGVSFNLDTIQNRDDAHEFVAARRTALWNDKNIERFTKSGLRGTQRIKQSIPFGKTWFAG